MEPNQKLVKSNTFQTALEKLPIGSWYGECKGSSYIITKTLFSGGRSIKLVAEELAGNDYISMNYYLLPSGKTLLKPCEMPEEKVVKFVLSIVPNQ